MTLNDGHWARIDTWQQLQRLLNDLVFYESQGQGILPSSPHIGADGGWDGKFVGTLFGHDGVHMLQAKYHRGTPASAASALRAELPSEIAKAIAKGADHLILATNAELTVDQATDLEAMDRGSLHSLTIWYRARLTQYLERHPAILFKYFQIGHDSFLVIPAEYFRRHEQHLNLTSLRGEAIDRIVDGITRDPQGLQLVHGRGGSGKSHLLRLIADRLSRRPRTIVRIITGTRQSLAQDVEDDLGTTDSERVVLLLDDAERYPTSVLTELANLVLHHSRYVGVVTCRSAAAESCRTMMGLSGRSALPTTYEVPPLSDHDLITLIRQYAPTRYPEDHLVRAAMRQFHRTPYLIRLWAEAHERGGLSREAVGREYAIIVQRLVADCRLALRDIIPEGKLPRFLGTLAASMPSTFDMAATNAVGVIAGLSASDVTNALGRLESGRVLRRIGRNLRFSPDTFGDLLFAQELTDPAFRKAIIEHLLALNPSGLAASIAAAGQVGDPTTAESVAAEILRTWQQEVHDSPWAAQDRFRSITQLALLAPADAFQIVRIHLETAGHLYDPDQDSNRHALHAALQNVDDILLLLGQHGIMREDILALVSTMVTLLPEQERKPLADLIKKLFRPLRGPIEDMTTDLKRMVVTLHDRHAPDAVVWVAEVAGEEVLAATHEDNFFSERTLTMRSQALGDYPQVRALRNAAMEVIQSLISTGRFTAAVSLARSIAKTSGPYFESSTETLPLGALFEAERRQFIAWITPVDLVTLSLADLHRLDSLCLEWWAHGQAEQPAAELLARIPRTAAYRFFVRQVSGIVVDDFAEVAARATRDDRWRWLLDNVRNSGFERDQAMEEAQQRLAESLAADYQTPEAVTGVLIQVTANLRDERYGGYGDSTLECWVRRVPDIFAAASRLPTWQQVDAVFRRPVVATLAQAQPAMFASLAARVTANGGSERQDIDDFLTALVATRPPLASVHPTLQVIAAHSDPRLRSGMLISLWQACRETVSDLHHDLVRRCLATGYAKGLLQPIAWIYHLRGKGERPPIPADIWEMILGGLVQQPEIDHDDERFFDEATDHEATAFFDFIERRLHHYAALRSSPDMEMKYRVFPRVSAGWAKAHAWTQEQADAYVALLVRNASAFEDSWELWHALDPLEVNDAVPDVVAASLVRALAGGDPQRSATAWEILRQTNSGRSLSAQRIREACEWLVANGKREDARRWLHGWQCGKMTWVGDDGVNGALLGTIALLAQLKNETTEPRTKALFSEVLRDLERERDRIRENHLSEQEPGMSSEEVVDLTTWREGQDCEAKAAQGQHGQGEFPKSFWDTYSAMANSDGGRVVLGAKERADGSFEVVGIAKPEGVLKELWDNLNNPQKVSHNLLRPEQVRVVQAQGQRVILIEIPRAQRAQRPIFINGNPLTGTFRRGHEGDYHCTEEQVRRMMADASPRPGDGQVLDGFSEEDLNPESLAAYRGLFASLAPSHPFLTGDTQALLRQLGGWNRDRERGIEGLTLAGLLMFGQQRSILDRLPHYHLDYQQLPVAAGGDTPRWIDRVTLDGTWSGNLFDFYMRVFPRLRDGLQLRFQLGGDQHRRDDTPQVQALREAFTNSLIHADYEGSGGIRIRRRSTGFEFINPGQLRMPIEQVHEGGRSDCRNPSLQTMFQMIGVGEKAGSGFPKIDQAWKEQHWRSPLLEEDLELDEIRLRLTTESLLPDEVMAELERKFPAQLAALDEVGRVALATAAIEGHVTNRRLQDLSDRHGRDLTMLLQDLCQRGFLKKAGRTTATTYTISDGRADSGQSDASLGQSGPSLGQSSGNSGQSSSNSGQERTELGDPVSVVAASPHAPRELVKAALLALCKGDYRTSKDLGTALNRDPVALRKRHLAPLVKEGVLELQFPDPNDPRQAYRTKAVS